MRGSDPGSYNCAGLGVPSRLFEGPPRLQNYELGCHEGKEMHLSSHKKLYGSTSTCSLRLPFGCSAPSSHTRK